jgi:hypothetical protein
MPLVSITALVHVEDYGQADVCARDYLDCGNVEVTVLEWDEVPMVAIPQNTSNEPF